MLKDHVRVVVHGLGASRRLSSIGAARTRVGWSGIIADIIIDFVFDIIFDFIFDIIFDFTFDIIFNAIANIITDFITGIIACNVILGLSLLPNVMIHHWLFAIECALACRNCSSLFGGSFSASSNLLVLHFTPSCGSWYEIGQELEIIQASDSSGLASH